MRQTGALVGVVSPRYAPAVGGVELHVEMLARGLARRGVGVEVITTDPTGRLPKKEMRDGVLVRRFSTVANDSVFYIAPSLGRWLWRNASRYTVLHAHSYHTPVALQAALAAQRASVPLVLTPHYHGTGHSAFRRALHSPYRLAGRWLVHKAQYVICMSATERELLHRHFGKGFPTRVIPNGVNREEILAAQPYSKPQGQVLVLAAGRLEHYKQTQHLVQAVPYLPPEYKVVVIGDGPARPVIEELVRTLGVEDRVTILGYISRPELLAWFATADVFVSLSQHEAFGLTLLEAALSGAAVVASDIPAHREVASFVPADRVSFVEVHAVADAVAGAILASAGKAPVEDRSAWPVPTWDAAVEGALCCYRSVGALDKLNGQWTAKSE